MASRGQQGIQSLDDAEDLINLFMLHLILGAYRRELHPRSLSENKKQLNLLLLGKTGYGKSATGNTFMGKNEFESRSSTTSVTTEVTCGQVTCGDYLVNMIDSPGLADTGYTGGKLEDKIRVLEKMLSNMVKAVGMCRQGVHAFLFVVKFGNRFTDDDKTSLQYLRQIFGYHFLAKHGIILFTYGDLFEQTMEEEETPDKDFGKWCREQTGTLGDLIKECSNRCVLFDNTKKGKEQRKDQINNLIRLVEALPNPYSRLEYIMIAKEHHKIILELRAPQLREKYQREISSAKLTIDRVCSSQDISEFAFVTLKLDTIALMARIDKEDGDTGLLNDLKESALVLLLEIKQHEMRQEERRQREKCLIL